jgi:hypothetical protein
MKEKIVVVSWKRIDNPVFYEVEDSRLNHFTDWDLDEMTLEEAIGVCGPEGYIIPMIESKRHHKAA